MRLSSSSFFIAMMGFGKLAAIAADECSSLQLSGHVSKKTVTPGGIVKLAVKVTNKGSQNLVGANLRLFLPDGADYQESTSVPKMKPRGKPIDLQPNIYWTDFNLNRGKSRKFDIKIKVDKCPPVGPLEFDFGVYFLDQNGDFDCSVETPSALKVQVKNQNKKKYCNSTPPPTPSGSPVIYYNQRCQEGVLYPNLAVENAAGCYDACNGLYTPNAFHASYNAASGECWCCGAACTLFYDKGTDSYASPPNPPVPTPSPTSVPTQAPTLSPCADFNYPPALDYNCPVGNVLSYCTSSNISEAVIDSASFGGPYSTVGPATCVRYAGSTPNATLAQWICGYVDGNPVGALKMVLVDLSLEGTTTFSGCLEDSRAAPYYEVLNATSLNEAWNNAPAGSGFGGYTVFDIDFGFP